MPIHTTSSRSYRSYRFVRLTAFAALVGLLGLVPSTAGAATPDVGLATADSFAVLAGTGITNTGPTTITGDIGTFPNPAVTGAASITLTGTNHAGDAVTQQAKSDLVTAYVDAAGRTPATEVPTDLGGQTLAPGVYDSANGAFGNTGILTLDGQNLTNPVFILQMDSTLITASASSVLLINGADACNVYWQVGSSATLGTGSHLEGTVMALTSITMTSTATLNGRILARNGAVTLNTNTITRAACATPTDTTTALTSSANPTTTASGTTLTATVTATDASTPTGSVEFFDGTTSLGRVALTGGTASLPTGALLEGTHTVTAVYLGDEGFRSSTSGGLDQVVTGTGTPGTPRNPGTSGTPSAPPARATPGTPTFTG